MEDKYCNEYHSKRERCCLDSVFSGLLLVLVFFVGVLIGTLGVLAQILTVGILVALIIVFAILAVLRIVAIICCGKRC